MRRTATVIGALALGGCIPQVDVPGANAAPPPRPVQQHYRDAPPPPIYDPPPDDDRPSRRSDQSDRNAPVTTLPAPPPAWESRTVVPDAVEIAASSIVARPSDTLNRVAERTGAGAEAIARANGLTPPFAITAGQRLEIPAGRYHLVRPGQTGIGIARAYGVEWSRIVAANGLAEPYVLRVGQRVLVPGAAAGNTRLAERAAAFRLDIDDIITGGEPALARNQAPAQPVATPRRVLPTTAAVVAPVRLASGFAWPVDGRIVKRFGPGASGERNDGIKIAVPLQTPIHATADGVVAYVGSGIAALGGLVIVKHGDRWTSVYGHAAKLLVQRGQAVKQGQTIALSGDTGFADRPEVHFELRRGRTPVDPTTELSRH